MRLVSVTFAIKIPFGHSIRQTDFPRIEAIWQEVELRTKMIISFKWLLVLSVYLTTFYEICEGICRKFSSIVLIIEEKMWNRANLRYNI